jgi:DNA invertase Pin-like site-specific DNA recombinase
MTPEDLRLRPMSYAEEIERQRIRKETRKQARAAARLAMRLGWVPPRGRQDRKSR